MPVNTENENIFGKDGFIWWIGVVEDRKTDPDRLGRVRVRIMGYHSDDLEILPTDQLPWAIVMQPTTSSAVSGFGSSPTNLLEGTWCIGFFLDAKEKQQPVVIGTIGGFTQKVPFCGQEATYRKVVFEGLAEQNDGIISADVVTDELGNPIFDPNAQTPAAQDLTGYLPLDGTTFTAYDFNYWENVNAIELLETEAFQDPNKEYPKCSYVDKPDTNKLATADLEDDDTPVYFKMEARVTDIPTAIGGASWDEPEPPYYAEYPYNQVIETEAGHVVEFDNTPGRERIHVYHKAGTYIEVDYQGTMVRKVTGDSFEVVEKNNHIAVLGGHTLTVRGAAKILVEGSCDLQVGGDMNVDVAGNYNLKVGKGYNVSAESVNESASGAFLVSGASMVGITSGAAVSVAAAGPFNVGASVVNLKASSFQAPPPPAQAEFSPTTIEADQIRAPAFIEPPEYQAVETEDFFNDSGVEGIIPIEYDVEDINVVFIG